MLISWFKKEAKGFSVCSLAFRILVLNFCYNIYIVYIFYYLNCNVPKIEDKQFVNISISLLFLFALAEEILFRLPLTIFARRCSAEITLLVAFILSIAFGYLHEFSFYNVFLQGIGGMFFSTLFLKTGGFQGKALKPLLVTSIVHFMFNAIIQVLLKLRA